MENDEWISVGDLRARIRASLPSIGVRPAAIWPSGGGVRFAFVVDGAFDGSRYGHAFSSPLAPLSRVRHTALIALSTMSFLHPYQFDAFSRAAADFAIWAFDIARRDVYRRSRPGLPRGSQNPNLVVQVNIYSNRGGDGGNVGGSRMHVGDGRSQVGRPSLQDGVLVLDALPLPPQAQGGRLVPTSQAPRGSVRGGSGFSRLVPPMGRDRTNSRFFDDDFTVLDTVERLELDGGGGAMGFGAVPTSASFLGSLPSTLYSRSSGSGDAEGQNCSICFEEPTAGDRVTELPCSHLFHTDCIVPWLKNSHLCPLCRHPLPIDQ